MVPAILTLDNLSCERDERILFDRVCADCEPGSLTQILGFNGSGKTTLLRAVAGLQPLLAGRVYWDGVDVARDRLAFARDLLFMGHHVPVKPHLTPLENVDWLRRLLNTRESVRSEQALEAVELAGFEDVPASALSAGQRRRVLLAQLYLSRARLWVLDEPFTAIDKMGVAQLQSLLADHARAGGVALLTSHQPLELPGLATVDLADYQAQEEGAYEW